MVRYPPDTPGVLHERTPSFDEPATPTPKGKGYRLPQVASGRDFSSNFNDLTLDSSCESGDNGLGQLPTSLDEGRNSEHIADRNISATHNVAPSLRVVTPEDEEQVEPKSQPLIPNIDQHAGNVADWNIVRNEKPTIEDQNDTPLPLKVKKRSSALHDPSLVEEIPHGQVSNDQPGHNRDVSWTVTPLGMEAGNEEESPLDREVIAAESAVARASLDKSLPPTPAVETPLEPSIPRKPIGALSKDDYISGHSKQDSANPIDLSGAIVHKDPDTVSMHEREAPAVTHEQRRVDTHEIRREAVTREVHHHDVYHRILPIKDVEVKPARHFVPVQDGLVEIAEEELPGRTREKTNWAIAELVSSSTPASEENVFRRQFTARNFLGDEGDEKEYISSHGHPVKEQTWVHPPTLDDDGRRAGHTHPFHFESEDPKEDGLQARVPDGDVVGVSRRLMQRRRDELSARLDSPGSENFRL